jgi:hypothetical protein
VQATDDGRPWEDLRPAPPETIGAPLVAGTGEQVAVESSTAATDDRSLEVLEVLVSSDAGRTWTTVSGLDATGAGRSRSPYSLVVGPGGTTHHTTETDGLVRIDADGQARRAADLPLATSAFVAGDEVCAVVEAGVVGELRCSDDGTTWARSPGRESAERVSGQGLAGPSGSAHTAQPTFSATRSAAG